MNVAARTSVVAVSGEEGRAELVETLMLYMNGYDVVVVESLAHGYSRIKQLMPDLVIVLFAMDDVAACQLFTMLASDSETSRIPVTTWTIRPELRTFGDIFAGPTRAPRSDAVRMH